MEPQDREKVTSMFMKGNIGFGAFIGTITGTTYLAIRSRGKPNYQRMVGIGLIFNGLALATTLFINSQGHQTFKYIDSKYFSNYTIYQLENWDRLQRGEYIPPQPMQPLYGQPMQGYPQQ